MLTPEDIQSIGQIPSAETMALQLAPGDDVEESPWKNMINCRLKVSGSYLTIQTRGGSEEIEDFFGQILTLHPFAATIDGVQKRFIAVHTAASHAYLYDVNAGSFITMFSGIFRTSGQVQFMQNGIFLYIFDAAEKVYKVFDLKNSTGYDWLGNLGKSITSSAWITGDWTDQNMWEIDEGARIIVFHKFQTGFYQNPETGRDSFRAFQSRIDAVYPDRFTYPTPDDDTYDSAAGGADMGFVSAGADMLDAFENAASAFRINENGEVETNTSFKEPIIYKSYILVDLLNDGSYVIPGRPLTVSSTLAAINVNQRLGVELTIPPADPGVSKRFLYATRWQSSEDNANNPNREAYPNSPYFLAKVIEITQSTVKDFTPDSKLLEPLSEIGLTIAGVFQIFGKNQLEPVTVASQKGTLLICGYRINRPVPSLYTDPTNPGDDNAFYLQEGAGAALTNNPELAIQYEYGDGKLSSIVDTAQILTDAEEVIVPGEASVKATVTFTVTSEPESDQTLEVILVSDPGNVVEVDYLSTDSRLDVATKIINEVNASTLGNVLTAEAAVNAGVKFVWDTPGDEGNQEEIQFTFGGSITIDNTSTSPLKKAFSGGYEGSSDITLSGNRLRFHSLNSLVSAIHVLVKVSGSYSLYETIDSVSPRFHGSTIYLPNTDGKVSALTSYSVPPAAQILEAVDLPGSVVPASPFQEPRVTEQFTLEGSVKIGRAIPLQFAPDKTELRYRLMIFTETNIQMGYLSFGSGQAFSFNANFEVVLEGLEPKSFDAIRIIGGMVFWPGREYFYMWAGESPIPLFNVSRYEVSANNNPIDVVFNQDNNEIWIIYPSQEVIVVDLSNRTSFRMDYSNIPNVRAGGFYDGNVYIGAGTALYRTDVESIVHDGDPVTPVEGVMETHHIGNPRTQAKILEVTVIGDGGKCSLDMDLQPERKEYNTNPWSDQFDADVSFGEKDVVIHGASFDVRRRAIMPRLRLTFRQAKIQDISMVQVVTENKGKARQQ